MPIIPTVFRPIRANDFQQRAFKAYKNYRINNTSFLTSSGYIHHQGLYKNTPIHIGVGSYNYPVNLIDATNKHVIWHSLNHRYYAHPYDPARSAELTNASVTSKNLYESASALIAPYLEVGEKIKPGSVNGTFSIGNMSYTLNDDGVGNLQDTLINSSSFASSSRNIFYLSFNKEFANLGPVELEYETRNFQITNGIDMTGIISGYSGYSFLSGNTTIGESNIRIPHEDKFNRFNHYDDWTISFWSKITPGATSTQFPLISKGGIRKITEFDQKNSLYVTKDKTTSMIGITGSYDKLRTPFVIGFESNNESGSWHFQSSNGTDSLHIQTDLADYKASNAGWKHIAIRNSASFCQIFIDGIASDASGSMQSGITSNNDDIIIGTFISGSQTLPASDNHMAEIRMYDYAASDNSILSLANAHYLSGSLFQTNIAGNIFYRNGELVVSSPMYKYNSGSGAFGETFNVSYKGTYTIYENEVLVRVPKDQFNVTMNPSATFTPATDKTLSQNEENDTLPGELRKQMFTSGTVTPYISTIGLYNDKAQLVAVSKLAQPIQKRNDIDMNFVIRWDY